MIKTILNNRIMVGFKNCPKWLKDKYRQAVNFTCQECHKHEDIVGKLQPHRKIRGCEGGLYTLVPLNHINNNVKVTCKRCHKKYHQGEFK